jgi:Legionella pneumophila major outer membrane protein precursor
MVRTNRWLLLLLCVGSWPVFAAPLLAQTPKEAPNPLPGLPHPPDQPSTLYAPAPAQPYSHGDAMPGCYFEPEDPRLDPPERAPGWIASVDATIGVPHILNKLTNTVQNPVTGNADTVHTGSANFDATVMPRVELGYRLPQAFGEIDLAWRGLGASGNTQIAGLDGLANLHSRLNIQIADLDYASREFSLGDGWGMKWRIGLRFSWIYFDSLASQSVDAARAGSGILDQHETNSYIGGGPHAGLEISRDIHWSGLSFLGRLDLADNIGRIKQGFFEDVLSPNAGGLPMLANNEVSSSQGVPSIQAQVGLAWEPVEQSNFRLFLGYDLDYWWNVGRESLTTSRGQMYFQGVVLQGQINY